jgi:5-methyltetrahydropteroyltriglutamate--homocysteine methyltransferase
MSSPPLGKTGDELMLRSENRILTTHTGSLPRPPELVRLLMKQAQGETVDAGKLGELGQAAVGAVVAKQAETGIDIINNGEQQREGFYLYMRNRLSGLGGSWKRRPYADVEGHPQFKAMIEQQLAAKRDGINLYARTPPKAIGDIRYLDKAAIDEECRTFENALVRAGRSATGAFMTAPSPGILAAAIRNEYYDSMQAYLAALGRALQVEYEAIVAHDFLLQVDCPDLALERHITWQDRPLNEFLDFVEMVVATLNDALANVPRESVRMHVCWGNYEGPHDHDVPLSSILPILLKADVGGLVLPFANGRHAHDVECFATMPLADDQVLVVGAIDSLTNVVEHPETIARRLIAAASIVGDPTRIMAGTDCGFDTAAGAGRVAEDVVWAKLRALVEGAGIASNRLF